MVYSTLQIINIDLSTVAMQKNTKGQTKRILSATTPATKLLRNKILDLALGESLFIDKGEWVFKSNPAEYLYTMKRVGREYSYRSIPYGKYLIVRDK